MQGGIEKNNEIRGVECVSLLRDRLLEVRSESMDSNYCKTESFFVSLRKKFAEIQLLKNRNLLWERCLFGFIKIAK